MKKRKEDFNKGNYGSGAIQMSSRAKKVHNDYASDSIKRSRLESDMIAHLVDGVYKSCIDGLPEQIGAEILLKRKILEDEISKVIINNYRELFVVCTDKVYDDMVKKFTRNLIITERYHGGMSIFDFLKWYVCGKESGDKRVFETLTEWSGIPFTSLKPAYNSLIGFFQEELQKKHRYGRRRTGEQFKLVANSGVTINMYGGRTEISTK